MNIKLRKLEPKDAVFMLEWMHDNDITCNFQQDFAHFTIDEALKFIEDSYSDTNQNFAVVDKSDEYLGTISLKHISYTNEKAEYAIVMRKKVHGTGAAQDATNELIKYAFDILNLHKVYLSVIEENIRAQKMYEKCGFKYEGLDIDSVKINGKYKNHKWYGIINNKRTKV
jgi:diamine N-acetyltransferase